MKFTFVGDIHGAWRRLFAIIDRHIRHNRVIQVGDLGVGFGEPEQNLPYGFYFIHGNHDNPAKCKELYDTKYHKNFLGRFGFKKEWNLFYVSGAWSIDANNRLPFVSWWPDEELSWSECQEVVELWNEVKPDYVVTHDCPDYVAQQVLGPDHHKFNTRMGQLFNQLWQDHKPKLWIFGHYHQSLDKELMGTRFICLNINEEKTLEINPHNTKDTCIQ
jgi:hypothetical protein